MRVLLLACAILLGVHAAVAAGGARVRRPTSAAAQLASPRPSLSAAARQSLAGTITRQQQLQVLQAAPGFSARLRNLGVSNVTQPMNSDPWQTGLTLTPLAPLYPGDATYDTYQLALQTRAGWLSPFSPLPAAAQTPPLLWLSVGANYDPLFWIEVKWPAPGAYLVTFFMKDLLPTSTAKPRVFKNGAGMLTPVPNAAPGGDQWTMLWEATTGPNTSEEIGVYPSESGFGFTFCCLSKVIIRKVQ